MNYQYYGFKGIGTKKKEYINIIRVCDDVFEYYNDAVDHWVRSLKAQRVVEDGKMVDEITKEEAFLEMI